jgi:hypothetical protein
MANGTAEIMTPDGDADEERGIQAAELYANFHTADGELRTTDDQDRVPIQRTGSHDSLAPEVRTDTQSRIPEPIVFTESLVGERGLSRRFRQKALGIHAGYLMVRRQHLMPQRRHPDGSIEYKLG